MHDDAHLIERLARLEQLRARGFEVSPGHQGDVALFGRGHFRGLWHLGNGFWHFTPGGYGEPTFASALIEEVIAHTIQVILRD